MTTVTAAIIRKNEKVLICQRKAGGNCSFLWEFPGGKLEVNETLEECLIRECKEELDIDIAVKDVFAKTSYQFPDQEIAFTFFNAELVSGTIILNVHNDYKWVLPKELSNYDFCPADVEILEKLVNEKM
jgi:8-oxo-dGTP diphosphatase